MKEAEKKYALTRKKKSFWGALIDVFRLRGFRWVTYYCVVNLGSILFASFFDLYYSLGYKSKKLSKKNFIFNKKKYNYFSHPYNNTWKHERAIEIPIAHSYLQKYKSLEVLEIGNVLSNYFNVKHSIVDNYEISKGVTNVDVMNFKPKKKYQFIVSVSTLEHVGVDGIKEKGKAIKAVRHLEKLLAPNGTLLFTIPIGYNKDLTRAIKSGELKLTEEYYFKKVTKDNKWAQVDKDNAINSIYGFPYHWGNAVVVGIIKK